MKQEARVLMSTIGSFHKLKTVDEVDNGGLTDVFNRMSIDSSRTTIEKKPTIVVFDEAGCIPCFELLGLTRLGRNIEALICVGDKHQLAPYSPEGDEPWRLIPSVDLLL